MTINHIKLRLDGGIVFSPFSGQPVTSEDGPNERDSTIVFTWFGDAGLYGYISPTVRARIADCDDHDPTELAQALSLDTLVLFEVDDGWNGTNFFAFAPSLSDR